MQFLGGQTAAAASDHRRHSCCWHSHTGAHRGQQTELAGLQGPHPNPNSACHRCSTEHQPPQYPHFPCAHRLPSWQERPAPVDGSCHAHLRQRPCPAAPGRHHSPPHRTKQHRLQAARGAPLGARPATVPVGTSTSLRSACSLSVELKVLTPSPRGAWNGCGPAALQHAPLRPALQRCSSAVPSVW